MTPVEADFMQFENKISNGNFVNDSFRKLLIYLHWGKDKYIWRWLRFHDESFIWGYLRFFQFLAREFYKASVMKTHACGIWSDNLWESTKLERHCPQNLVQIDYQSLSQFLSLNFNVYLQFQLVNGFNIRRVMVQSEFGIPLIITRSYWPVGLLTHFAVLPTLIFVCFN